MSGMNGGKIVHYCWFGKKPLSGLARECIESWKTFLPDYEFVCWNEENSDLDDCPFVRGAYQSGAYAFVADYVRTKALYEMGGIYFDTDMKIIKDPTSLLKDNESFLGVEDTGKVSCGVWYESKKHGFLAGKLLEKYRSFEKFDFEKRAEFGIPLLLTEILEKCGFDYKKRRIQKLSHGITIYPREYFYPYSYNWNNNYFTDNTYMIHYYDASWLPLKNRIENFMVRRYGRVRAIQMIRCYQKTTVTVRKVARLVLYPVVLYRRRKKQQARITREYFLNLNDVVEQIRRCKKSPYLVFYNKQWLGVASATDELFEHGIQCGELYRGTDVKRAAREIVKTGVAQVVFSAVCDGWPELMREIHRLNPKIKLKVFWHGSMSQVLDEYGFRMHEAVMKLQKKGVVTAFATCKKSLYGFYKAQGVPVYFITNKVELPKAVAGKKKLKAGDAISIGLYAASPDNWRKNMLSQIAAVALMKDAVLDIVPLNSVAEGFAKAVGVKITGVKENLSREEMIKRMGKNDVNLYVTFSECAPMLPLESLEVGVPCITGNNHHFFKGRELEKYLVVDNETDVTSICEKIKICLKNRRKIIELYNEFREDNFRQAKENVKEFLEA